MDASISIIQVGLSLVAGALSTLSPCVFPLLPMVLAAVVHAHHRTGPLAMGAGMVVAFVFVGVGLGALGPVLGVDSRHVRVAAGAMLLLIALLMFVPDLGFGESSSNWLSRLATFAQGIAARLHPETYSGAFLLGGVLGLIWAPCSGPLLGSGLALVATKGGLLPGGLILGAFGVGAAIPLMLAAYASRRLFMRIRKWVLGHSTELRHWFAPLIGLMGVAVLTGADRWIEARLLETLPDAWVALTTRF